jgi:hypothetical protein
MPQRALDRLPDDEILSTDAAIRVRVILKKRLDQDQKRIDQDEGTHVPDPIHHLLFKRPLFRDVGSQVAPILSHLVSVALHDTSIQALARRKKPLFISTVAHEGSIVRLDPNSLTRDRDHVVDAWIEMWRDFDVGRHSIFYGCRNRNPMQKNIY